MGDSNSRTEPFSQPGEWFLVPLAVIDEAVNRIRDGSIARFIYNPSSATLVSLGG